MARDVAGRFRRFLGGCGPRAATTLAVLVLAGVAVPARADFPGEVLNVHDVDVDVASAAPGHLSRAVLTGLRQANQVYFYGDRPAKMRATVRAEGVVDVQVIDVMTGSILLERQGLSFPTGGEGASPAPAADTAADSSVLAPSRTIAPAPRPVTEGTAAAEPAAEPGQRLALAPATGPAPQRVADAPGADARDSGAAGESQLVLAADALQPAEPGSGTSVESRVAAVDGTAEGPTLANARWVGFTPAVFTGSDTRPGAWIAGPFDRNERTGWITDTATGATTRVTFLWREGGRGSRTATLSQDAARALGLGQGDVANVAVYLPR